jgi:outer membrane receptor protein involved in Fe transport
MFAGRLKGAALLLALLFTAAASAQQSHERFRLSVVVTDENGVAVSSARLTLTPVETKTVFKGDTDYAGRHEFADLQPGPYQLQVEKEGFYAAVVKDVQLKQATRLEVTLHHQQEFAEVVDVIYSPPAIDLSRIESSQHLSNQQIINLPYPTTRDIRNALPLIAGILQDATGQIHLNGSASRQIFAQLDGFNVSDPVNGLLTLRVSTDAIRSIEAEGSRYSAEYGKGSGGVLSLTTGMGDDHYRFSATDFIPSFQSRRGLSINNWTPRATLSGPLSKKRAWFFEAADGEYGLKIISELPRGADRSSAWRLSNLAKAQVNLSSSDILTASFLLNRFHSDHAGLSRFNPLETTLNQSESAYLLSLKEQSYLSKRALVEFGLSISQFSKSEIPLGQMPYVITPEGARGNFFRAAQRRARRIQWIASAIFPAVDWRGKHEFKFGVDIDRITYAQSYERRPITILREDGTLARRITFPGAISFQKNNLELSGFAQDRWSLTDRLLLELGLRLDWDEVLRATSASPRIASSYLLTDKTKIAAGVGVFADATDLDLITRSLAGQRTDYFYASAGKTLRREPLLSIFRVNEAALKRPRLINCSAELERKLPASLYLRVEFIKKRGQRGFAFINNASQALNLFELSNSGRDRYSAIQITLRRDFKGGHYLLASYTRSRARSNAVLDFSLDNPIFSQQAGGRLPWDAPNRLMAWGWLPLVKGFDLAYWLEWRDGFPFSVIDQDQQIVGPPNSRRLPDYFSLNTHVERRFRLFGFQWALRVGFNNLTNRDNPTGVNNNIDSPQFLTLGGLQHRTFLGRIRLLGRK